MNIGFKARRSSAAFLWAGLLLGSALGWATSDNCPGGFTSTTTNSINNATGEIGSLANGMTASTTPFVSGNGCGAVNQTFGNFFESGFTTQAGTYAAVGTAPDPGTQEITFQTEIPGTGDTNNDFVSGAGTNPTTGDIVYLTQFGTGTSPATNPDVAYLTFELTGVDLEHVHGGNTSSIVVNIYACENVTSASTAAFTNCTGNGGTLEHYSVTFQNTSPNTSITNATEIASFALPTSFTNFDIDTNVVLTGNSDGATSFSGLEEAFDAAPEPSTIALMGSALALGAFGMRKRRA